MAYSYFRVDYTPPDTDGPNVSFHEVDEERWEKRRVEVYGADRVVRSDTVDPDRDDSLSLEPLPPIAEIDAQPEFSVTEISSSQFEAAWAPPS